MSRSFLCLAVNVVSLAALLLLPRPSFAQSVDGRRTPNADMPTATQSPGTPGRTAAPGDDNKSCYVERLSSTCAWVSTGAPAPYETVTVYGSEYVHYERPAGVHMIATWHFESGTQTCIGTTDLNGVASCSLNIGPVAFGYRVNIDVNIGGMVVSTWFTVPPKFEDCTTATGIFPGECAALVALYNSTNGAGWSQKTGWLMTNAPCNWAGVECTTGHVARLWLSSNHLSGSIPAELGNLPYLGELNLSGNQLIGNIPPESGNLVNLRELKLSSNHLSGNIPSELGNLVHLESLDLSSNQLSGSIGPELGNLSRLLALDLSSNQLSGSIPPELAGLPYLSVLYLNSNELTGGIPPELGNLAHLKYLRLNSNQVSGSIPPELGSLPYLGELNLAFNQLSGSIPPELGHLPSWWVYLNSNQLSGGIPPELGNLCCVGFVDLSANRLSGSVPSELGNLGIGLHEWSHVEELNLASNQLIGPLPQGLTKLRGLQKFFFDAGPLCIPDNWCFQSWFARIPYKSEGGPTCSTGMVCVPTFLPALSR